MIAPSGAYRVPRSDPTTRNAEARRYARDEYGTSSLAWMLPASSKAPGLWTRLTSGLAAVFSRPRAQPARPSPRPAPLRTGHAAVHFAGEPTHAHHGLSHPDPDPHWHAHPAGSLLLPVLDPGEKSDRCECQP